MTLPEELARLMDEVERTRDIYEGAVRCLEQIREARVDCEAALARARMAEARAENEKRRTVAAWFAARRRLVEGGGE